MLRPTGPHRVHLVQAAGGPLGGDDLGLTVHLGPGTVLQVRSAAATLVQPSHPEAAAQWTVTADLADGAVLDWRPEPTILCDGAELRSSMQIGLQRGARALLREVVVLGRVGQVVEHRQWQHHQLLDYLGHRGRPSTRRGSVALATRHSSSR
ncbi:MAG: urease accessory protein UreD [Pseudonocardiaceae bacterium]